MKAQSSEVIEWLGTTPQGWIQPRLKALFRDNTGAISIGKLAELEVQHYSIPNFDRSGGPALEDGTTIASNKTLLRGGEILFSKLNCHKPRVWLVPYDDHIKVASTEFIPLAEWRSGSVDKRFVVYLVGSAVLAEYMTCFQTSVTNSHRRINPSDLWQTRIPLPPLPEQKRIAAYLDASCAAIDAAVTAKRHQLETLDAARESIIETAVTRGLGANPQFRAINHDWIGSLPEHWAAVRIKRVISHLDYGISVSSQPAGKYPVLKMGNIQSGEIVFSKMEFVDEVAAELLLEKNDLLYNRTNSPDQVGKAALFLGCKEDEVTFASYLVRLRVNHRIIPEFLNYAVNCAGFLAFARRLAIPSVQQSNLNSTRYARMCIPLPPISEQQSICQHLRVKIGEIKRVVNTIETQVATLTAYRKSLIHECVTGQRRIMEADVNR